MADFDNIHELIDETIYPNSAGEINAEEHNAMLHDILDAVNEAKEDKVFVATFGTTTYAELLAAYNAGKKIICKKGTYIGYLIYFVNGLFCFSLVSAEDHTMIEWQVGTNDNWETFEMEAASTTAVAAIEAKIPSGTTASNKLVNQSTMDTEMGQNFSEFQQTITDPIDDRLAAAEGKIPADASASNKLVAASDLAGLASETWVNANYVHKVVGKGLSSEDYTAFDKVKVANLPSDTNAELAAHTQSIAENKRDIAAIIAQQDNLGNAHAIDVDTDFGYKRNGKETIIFGSGAPSATTIPDQAGIPFFIGQQYIDTTASSSGLWYAAGTDSVSDWKKA